MDEIEDAMFSLEDQYALLLGEMTKAEVKGIYYRLEVLLMLMDKHNIDVLPDQDY